MRKVFFSFHYKKDVWRTGQVRNSWLTKPDRASAGFIDSATWEKIEKQGDEAIKRWINSNLKGTSVTVILIGTETSTRKWVKYEIEKSYEVGNGMLGIYIHNIKNALRQTAVKGRNPFDNFSITRNGRKVYLSQIYKTYDWINDKGYDNLGSWVEQAAKQTNR